MIERDDTIPNIRYDMPVWLLTILSLGLGGLIVLGFGVMFAELWGVEVLHYSTPWVLGMMVAAAALSKVSLLVLGHAISRRDRWRRSKVPPCARVVSGG